MRIVCSIRPLIGFLVFASTATSAPASDVLWSFDTKG